MAENRAQRRLAAILAADVVGYSRLMEQDETGTLAALKARRNGVLAPMVAQHNGRVVKLMGDGVLVEFGSAVDAVQCAVELQKGFSSANQGVSEAQSIVLRIGINLGDVIVERSDIYGDGVNIAARLEGLAEPGSIYVSGTVHDHVSGKLMLAFDDLGEHTLKNIAKPVKVYRAASGWADKSTARPAPALPDKPSIAVLPFVNMSGDTEQEHFVDGLTEDIITDLSNVPDFFVIARNSTFAYKGKPTDVRQIARDLGVKYILEGSARRSGQRLRINVQLIDAVESGNHVLAERFDREIADIFVVQDEVTRRVVEAITGKLGTFSLVPRPRPSTLEAYDLCVRARSLWWRTTEANQEAMVLLERVTAIDPNYAEAHWQLALVQFCAWQLWGADQQPNRTNALISARRAVEIDPNDSSAYWVLGYILLHESRWDEGAARLRLSIRLNPNDADAQAILSELLIMTGRKTEAIEPALTALRLNPLAPGWIYWILGIAQIANGQVEAAVRTLRREETYSTVSRRTLAAALALLGQMDEARHEMTMFVQSNPHWRIRDWRENHPMKLQEDQEFWINAYRLAGFPE